MARPQKNNADYFPHDNDLRNDRRCKALRSKYNIEGFGIFIMFLEVLTQAEHFQIENNAMETELLAGDFDIDSNKLNEILEYLLKIGLLEQNGAFIFSPLLNGLKNILLEYREKERNRKRDNKEKENDVFQAENSGLNSENEILHTENHTTPSIFHTENLQSKVKESKQKEIKQKKKGVISQPPIFEIINKEKNIASIIYPSTSIEKEKSSGKKEKIIESAINSCKDVFLKETKFYYWEKKDDENLPLLLKKILETIKSIETSQDLLNSFTKLIQKLPEYWRSKKFTVPNINQNFNEIVNEISAKAKTTTGNKFGVMAPKIIKRTETKEQEITEERKREIRKGFIQAVCDMYDKFIETGGLGIMSMHLVYDLFVKENLLQINDKKLKAYEAKAIQQRKAELNNPQNKEERNAFKTLLDSYVKGANSSEQFKIDVITKELAVKDFLSDCKKKNTDLKKILIQAVNK